MGENCLYSAILGGVSNQVSHFSAVVLGGERNHASAPFSLAAGRRARAGHIGTFVWADSSGSDFLTERADQFLIRAQGGVGIGTSATRDAPLTGATVGEPGNPVGGARAARGVNAES